MSKPVKLPSGKWMIRWFDVDGVRQAKAFATYDLARSELRRLTVAVDEDKTRRERLGSGAATVLEAGTRFLASYKRNPDDTERRYLARKNAHERHFTTHIEPHLGSEQLCDLTPAVLRKWLDKLLATKTNRRGEVNADGTTLSASTIRNVVVTLRQICEAEDVPIVVKLAKKLKQKHKRSRPRALQCIEDVRAMIDACTDPWFKVAAAIACYCGARLGEVASLRWRHIGEQTIAIALSWEGPLKHRFDDDEGTARTVPLDVELAAILNVWRKVTNGADNDHVVLVNGERPLREGHDDVAAKTRAACKRAGVTPIVFHELRHSFGTIAANGGLPLPKLQALLGHANIATTGIYVNPESAHAALDPRARLSGSSVAVTTESAADLPN